MSTTMKTPGVYIQELDAFGNSVVPVPTAVPAFIGYTEQTSYDGQSLVNKAVRITSLAEYLMIFGNNPPKVRYSVSAITLPERLQYLQSVIDGTKKQLAKANKAAAKANKGAKGTPPKTQDQTDAEGNLNTAIGNYNAAVDAIVAAFPATAASGSGSGSGGAKPAPAAKPAAKPAAGGSGATAQKAAPALSADQLTAVAEKTKAADFVSYGIAYTLKPTTINYRMYSAMKFFYENGGGPCYVTSIGGYDYTKQAIGDTTPFTNAITELEKESEPTMLVIPDLVEVQDPSVDQLDFANKYENAYSLQQAMINHCGSMMNRVAVLDIPGAYVEAEIGDKSYEVFRSKVEPENPKFNSYAAVYYPWLHTTVYQSNDVGVDNIDEASYGLVNSLLSDEFVDASTAKLNPKWTDTVNAFYAQGSKPADAEAAADALEAADKTLKVQSKAYKSLMKYLQKCMNLMAPSAAMAGLYHSVDDTDGVWKAPANIGIQSVSKPAFPIDHDQQEDLNVPLNGKSVCAIRAFTGRGNLVWGARTLDGNSDDWRYINVRRTMIFLEQSVKEAAKAYVFAPNDASTWVDVKSMISNFLFGVWKQGGLVGPKAADAYSVSVGLGSTMTGEDILQGIMRVSVKVAVSHPAEFIEITFQQQMQKA